MRTIAFEGDFPITQSFGENPANYAGFTVPAPGGGTQPMQGHNGCDFGLPSGTPLLSPEDGVVAEVAYDPTGYGWYVKVLPDAGGNWLHGHMEGGAICVSVGARVRQGSRLGVSDNTGNSTGPHLHLGYRPPNANMANGFGGYVDPLPRLQALTQGEDPMRLAELETQVNDLQGQVDQLNGVNTTLQEQLDAVRGMLADADSTIGALEHDVIPALQAASTDPAAVQAAQDKLEKIKEIVNA